MPIRNDTDDIVNFLNEILKIDTAAMTALVNARVPCGEALAGHPSVQVGLGKNFDMEDDYVVGFLGLINGYAGTIDAGRMAGLGPIIAHFENDQIIRFARNSETG